MATPSGRERGRPDAAPLQVAVATCTAEAVIGRVLDEARREGKVREVARCLVGATLTLSCAGKAPPPARDDDPSASGRDSESRSGDLRIGNTVILIAMGLAWEQRLEQISRILDDAGLEVWPLVPAGRVPAWRNELEGYHGLERGDRKRVVICSVEAFVGQSISVLGEFTSAGKAAQLQALFEVYNTRWVAAVGTPGIRIVVK